MWETLIALSLVGALLGTGLLYRFVPWLTLLRGGALLVVVGGAFSVLGGIVYHVMLYRTLGRRGVLRPRWWWHPTQYHADLLVHERPQVMPWFYAGAAAFVVVMVGCFILLLSVLRSD